MKRVWILVLVGIVLAVGPTATVLGGNPPSRYFVDERKLPFEALAGTSTTRYWGVHKGAGYWVEVPENWNGDLVLYCHGYRGYVPELTLTAPRIRAFLIANGFAWAASSYSTNGYDVKAGVKDTHALAKYFNGLVGKPRRTYITGHSMGGHVTGVALEQYPQMFAGALPMCGVMGDCELFDFHLDFQVLAQYFTGTVVSFPWPENYTTVLVPGMQAALGAGIPGYPGFPFTLSAAGMQLRQAVRYRSGGERPLYDTAFLYWGNFLFGQGLNGDIGIAPGNTMENWDTIYQLDGDPVLSASEAALNEQILRVTTDPQGRHPNGLANIPAISGDIGIPVLTMHTIGDLFVSFSMQQIYAQRVADHGKSDLLVQRVIRDVGHCTFKTGEEEAAFADLVYWVENGVRPAGDKVLDAQSVAAPHYGCQFTQGTHSIQMGSISVPMTPCP
jgi:pimeloyl-ACP methyl ester carboxylesterase